MKGVPAFQTIVVSPRGVAKDVSSGTLASIPLEVLKKYASPKPLRRRAPRKKKQ